VRPGEQGVLAAHGEARVQPRLRRPRVAELEERVRLQRDVRRGEQTKE